MAAELNGSVLDIGSNQRGRMVQAPSGSSVQFETLSLVRLKMTFLAAGRCSAGKEIPIEILRMRGGRIVKELIENVWRKVLEDRRSQTVRIRLARSRICSEQRTNACGQRHGKRAPERGAHCAQHYRCAARACGQPAQKNEEYQ